jgi:hypothetical protein
MASLQSVRLENMILSSKFEPNPQLNWPSVPGCWVISFVTLDSAAAEAPHSSTIVVARNQTSVLASTCEQVNVPGAYVTPARARMDVSQSENIKFKMSAMSLQGSKLSPITPMPCKFCKFASNWWQ